MTMDMSGCDLTDEQWTKCQKNLVQTLILFASLSPCGFFCKVGIMSKELRWHNKEMKLYHFPFLLYLKLG